MGNGRFIKCIDCGFAVESDNGLVCTVHGDAGWFGTPDNGFCHRAKPNHRCGRCKRFRKYMHGFYGVLFDGLCLLDGGLPRPCNKNTASCKLFEENDVDDECDDWGDE